MTSLFLDIADEVAIMYAGRIFERGPVDAVFDSPHHPYTHGLLASLPQIDRTIDKLAAIPGSLPSLSARPAGCRFHPRCVHAQDICRRAEPELRPVASGAIAGRSPFAKSPVWRSLPFIGGPALPICADKARRIVSGSVRIARASPRSRIIGATTSPRQAPSSAR